MTLEEASQIANAIALRFAEFAMEDESGHEEWAKIAASQPSAGMREICEQNAKRYRARQESREREAKAITTILFHLSASMGGSDGSRRRNDAQDEASHAGAAAG